MRAYVIRLLAKLYRAVRAEYHRQDGNVLSQDELARRIEARAQEIAEERLAANDAAIAELRVEVSKNSKLATEQRAAADQERQRRELESLKLASPLAQ